MGSKAGRRISSGWLLGTVATVATVAIGGLASGAGLKTKQASTVIAADESGTATAKCKRGLKVVSGGFDSPGFDPTYMTGPSALPFESLRESGRKWSASAANYSAVDSTVTAYAYCRKGKRLHTESESTTIAPLESGSVTASCKTGEKVVSGGSGSPDFEVLESEAFPYSSRKTAKRDWTVGAINLDDNPSTLTAYAYCRDGKGVKTKSASTPIGPPPDDGTATAKCKRGQRLVSGGFDNPDFDGLELHTLPFRSLKQGGREWTVSAYNEGNGDEGGTLTVYAYCEKK